MFRSMKWLALSMVLVWALSGCGDAAAVDQSPDPAPEPEGFVEPTPDAEPDDGMAMQPDAEPEPQPEPEPDPAFPEPPEPGAYSAGTCPELVAGRNSFQAGEHERSLLLYLPEEPIGAPLVFMWHPLGADAATMARFFSAAQESANRGLIIAVPDSCCSPQSEWGYIPGSDSAADLSLFDDLLTCLDQQFQIDRRRVYTTGFSAGALWSSYLVMHRGQHLAAAAIFSGGSGSFLPYRTPEYPLPVLLVDGGETDVYGGVVNFQTMTAAFKANLIEDGHFVIHCQHTGGHTVPSGAGSWSWPFTTAHAYSDGSSPLAETGLGNEWPSYCEAF